MQAQRYASTKMDYLVYNGYNNLADQPKKLISDSTFKDAVALGSIFTDDNGISRRTVTVSVYSEDEAQPRAQIQQVFYSNDANKYVTNGSSATSSISLNYDKDNDKFYAIVDGQEKVLGSNSGVPIGTVITWAANSVPIENGVWLECNGQSCADYPKLVAVLGKNTVPDYRGRFLQVNTVAGNKIEAGLPNITGAIIGNGGSAEQLIGDRFTTTGAFLVGTPNSKMGMQENSNATWGCNELFFDASLSNSIYGVSETVQPASYTVRCFIKAV